MPRLVIVRGLPGSSKSTYAKSLNIFHIEADMFFQKDGEYKWFPTGDNHKWCFNVVSNAMLQGIDVVVSNTFTQAWEMEKYIKLAANLGYEVKVIRCENDFGNTHNVPLETIEKMKARFEDYPGEIIYKAVYSDLSSLLI